MAGSAAEALGLFSIVLAVFVALGLSGEEQIVAVASVLSRLAGTSVGGAGVLNRPATA